MFEITEAIFSDILSFVKARVVVGYINGQEQDDAVIAFLRQRGVDIIDMRPSPVLYEKDSLPFDGHPGPIGQYHYFRKILNYLQETDGTLSDRDARRARAHSYSEALGPLG
jgi:hypothetical protein